MTSRELTSSFEFWSRGHQLHLPVKFGAHTFIQSGFIYIFPKFWIMLCLDDFRLCEFGYSGVLTVWYLCSVPNWVKIYALATDIDALMLQTFI